jgi:hypothetical protein
LQGFNPGIRWKLSLSLAAIYPTIQACFYPGDPLTFGYHTVRGTLHEPCVATQGRHVRFEDRFPMDDGTKGCGAPDYSTERRNEKGVRNRVSAEEHIDKQKMISEKVLPVNRIVSPSTALLHANSTPLRFSQKTTLGKGLCEFLG